MLVLHIDDSPTERCMVRRLLESVGMTCVSAASSDEALELLDRPFDVVVQDVARGDDDAAGLDLYTSHLRQRGLPTIFLTGYDLEVMQFEDMDCEFLSKRVYEEQLLGKIREVVSANTCQSE